MGKGAIGSYSGEGYKPNLEQQYNPKVALHALGKAQANQLSEANLNALAKTLPPDQVALLRQIRDAAREQDTDRVGKLSTALEAQVKAEKASGEGRDEHWKLSGSRVDKRDPSALKKLKEERAAILEPLQKAIAKAPAEARPSLQSWAKSYEQRAIDATVFDAHSATLRPSGEQALRDAKTLLADLKSLKPENAKEWLETERKKLFAEAPPPVAQVEAPPLRTYHVDDRMQALIDGYAQEWFDTVSLAPHHASHLSEGMKPRENEVIRQLFDMGLPNEAAKAEILKAKQKHTLAQ